MRILYQTFALLLLIGIASAGTVTLTGTCGTYSPSSKTINFTLSNSGNDSAYNLVITPTIPNTQTANGVSAINNLGPSARVVASFNITNILRRGTVPAYFTVAYQQGSEVFTAVFPCTMSLLNSTSSQVLLTTNSSIVNGNATVKIKVFNAGTVPVTANVSLILPPSFTYQSVRYSQVTLAQYQTANVTFSLSAPVGSQSSYSVAAAASYLQGNLSHASLVTFIIRPPQQVTAGVGSLLLLGVGVVVAAVIVLIVLSLLRKRSAAKTSQL